MLWDVACKLKPYEFKRKTGFRLNTFEKMVEIVDGFKKGRREKDRRGNYSRFTTRDEILIMLWYYREYVTYFSIATELGIHETSVYRIIKKTEEILIRSKQFSLPGKKVLRNDSGQFEVIIVDAAESVIERPKRSRVKKGKKD